MRKLNSQNKLLSMNSSSFDSSSWVIHIKSFFEEQEVEDDIDNVDENNINVCVYNVPKSLRALKPEAYSPQIIALGPYHHWREDLYEMERFKLICSKKVQKEFKNLKFEELVKKLMKKEHQIRGSYHKYLDMGGEALAWMMAIDGLFLLEFLHVNANKNNSLASEARMSFLANAMGKKLSHISILNDILMLENQIPIFVLKKILSIQCSRNSSELVQNLLPSMLMSVCKELSPLVLNEKYPISEAICRSHLLDLFYHLMVPSLDLREDKIFSMKIDDDEDDPNTSSFGEHKEVFTNTWEIASKLKQMKKLQNILSLKPFKFLAKLPIKVLSKLPIVSAMTPMLESMFLGDTKEDQSKSKNGGNEEEILLVEEIMIPSVTNLCDAGVEFSPTDGDISTIRFDHKMKIFYLPVIRVDGNTEVLMRNLIAFEASTKSNELVLARFSELMNGIIDTSKDVEILRKKKIIISRLRKDEDVANIWNGMTKAIRLSKVGFIDEAIKDINGYYKNIIKRKLHKIMKRYVYNSWRILVVLATLLLLALMVLQSFCTVYSCPRFFNIDIDDANSTNTN
ncbi:putative UPF0481 protein At3g02645 [Amaranthus tricolor]|uniref:putative UPF0481 protein At3g02645 n=1 Tax=Amaranthus tricolor TaxID=29722 RepID=UPI0025859FA6|nr:putative UPF0481 protein At3g02645 [Amaranthus tricolor]